MKTFLCWSGWVIAFVLCAALGMVYLWGTQQAEEVNRLGIERSKQEAQLNNLKNQLAAQAESIKPATPPAPAIQPSPPTPGQTPTTPIPSLPVPPPTPSPEPITKPSEPETKTTEPETKPSEPEVKTPPAPSTVPTGNATPPAEKAPAPGVLSPAGSTSQPVPSPSNHEAESGLAPQVSTPPPTKRASKFYETYFSLVELPNDIEQQIRSILQHYQSDRIALTQDLTQNRIPIEAYTSKMIDMRNQVRAALGTILIPAHMNIWNEYEATLPERLMGQQLEQALLTGGTTLPLTARAHIQEVLLQEMTPVFEAQHKDLLPLELPPGMAAQPLTEAYNRARMRLEKDFSQEEMKQTGPFLEKQLSQITPRH